MPSLESGDAMTRADHLIREQLELVHRGKPKPYVPKDFARQRGLWRQIEAHPRYKQQLAIHKQAAEADLRSARSAKRADAFDPFDWARQPRRASRGAVADVNKIATDVGQPQLAKKIHSAITNHPDLIRLRKQTMWGPEVVR